MHNAGTSSSSYASMITCAAVCNAQQPPGACNAYRVEGNGECAWAKLRADYVEQGTTVVVRWVKF